MNYDTAKRHLLKRFDFFKEIGQKRLLFRQAKRDATQTLEEFYTHLLGLAAKAFPDESAETIDRMITDQFIVGCEVDRTRLHLIEKGPRTSREALALGIAHQAAIRYNKSLKDTSTVSAVEYHVSAATANRPTRAHGRGRRVYNANPNQGYNQNNRWSNNNNCTCYYGQQNYQPQQTYRQQYRSSVPNTQFQNGTPFFRIWGNNQRGSGRGPGRRSGRERGQFHGQWGNGSNNRNEEQGGQHYSTNGISSPSCPLYVNGIFGSVEIPILLDTESAVTVIDEEIWKMMKAKDGTLEKVPFALGAVLSQLDDEGKERPIAFTSRILSKTERKWGITEREAFAIVWAVNYFRSYFLGNKFDLFTDHRPLTFLRTLKNPSPKIARWLVQLEEYEYNIHFKEGKSNANDNAMSRLPMYDEGEEVNTVQASDIIELSSFINLDEIREAQGEDEMLQEVLQILDTGNTDTVSSRK